MENQNISKVQEELPIRKANKPAQAMNYAKHHKAPALVQQNHEEAYEDFEQIYSDDV